MSLRLRLLATVRAFAPVEPWRPEFEEVAVVSRIDDPLRCRCPECLMLDAMYPGQGYQLALYPYIIQQRRS